MTTKESLKIIGEDILKQCPDTVRRITGWPGTREVYLMDPEAFSTQVLHLHRKVMRLSTDGSIIGAIRYRKINDHIEIGRLMVAQEHRRQGVATDLLRDVEERTQERVFELYTCTKSWINIRLYEKLGYRTFREEAGENGLSFAYMRKTASRDGVELGERRMAFDHSEELTAAVKSVLDR